VILTSVMPLEPGEYTCRLVIRDLDTGLSAVSSAKALVPAISKSGLKLGTPLLLQEDYDCIYLEVKFDNSRLSRLFSEIYSFDQKVFVPLAGQFSKQTRHLRVLVPFNTAEGSEAQVALAVQLIEASTGQLRPVEARLVETIKHSRGETAVLDLSLPELKPGDYFLYVSGRIVPRRHKLINRYLSLPRKDRSDPPRSSTSRKGNSYLFFFFISLAINK